MAQRQIQKSTLLIILFMTSAALIGYYSVLLPEQMQIYKKDDLERETEWTSDINSRVKLEPAFHHEKWIIVTTIHAPTAAMLEMSKLPGWKLLVVADKKTPASFHMHGAVLLTLEKQGELNYEVNKYLSYNTYTRKVIGYLYAIEHGARHIYDTDDDNYIQGHLLQFQLDEDTSDMMLLKTQAMAVNHHPHFGQSTMWPRGLPLGVIGEKTSRDYQLCRVHTPVIQQGLVDGDPDVDAVFRLTRKENRENIEVEFDKSSPAVLLPKGSFSPTNAQATMYSYNGFWSLIMPVTVNDRASDIYRAYWSQRLLGEIGENIGFFPPTAIQKRNVHSYEKDFSDESELYRFSGNLIHYLHDWNCSRISFYACIRQLSHDLMVADFFKHHDSLLIDAWLKDLTSIGYKQPQLRAGSGCLETDKTVELTFYPVEQNTTALLPIPQDVIEEFRMRQQDKAIVEPLCHIGPSMRWRNNRINSFALPSTLLVLGVHGSPIKVIPLLEIMYRPHFPRLLYCGRSERDSSLFHKWRASYITPPSGRINPLTCIQIAIRLLKNVESYLYLSDNMFLNMEGLVKTQSTSSLWIPTTANPYIRIFCESGTRSCVTPNQANRERFHKRLSQMNETKHMSKLQHCILNFTSVYNLKSRGPIIQDLAFNLPSRSAGIFNELATIVLRDEMIEGEVDNLVLLLMECLADRVHHMSFGGVKEAPRDKQDKFHYVFPFHLEKIFEGDCTEAKHFCGHLYHVEDQMAN